MCIGLRHRLRLRYWSVGAINLYVLVPLLPQYWSAVNLEANVVVLDLHKRNVRRITRLYRWAPKVQRLLQFDTIRGDYSIFQRQTLRPHGEDRPRVYQLSLKVADNLETGFLGNVRSVSRNRSRRGLHRMIGRLLNRRPSRR